jgi:DNA-directed RNA polymerase subunit M/transcription elongation factor TFIIS
MNIKHIVAPNLRLIKRSLIIDSITNNDEACNFEIDEVQRISSELEEICYKYAVDAVSPCPNGLLNPVCEEIYHLKIGRCIGFFEDEKGSAKLFKKIVDGEIELKDLPDVNIIELFPERYSAQLARIDETGKDMPVKYTTLYHCRRCKQNQCTIQSAQTRSLDECNTIFVSCKCGHVFTV